MFIIKDCLRAVFLVYEYLKNIKILKSIKYAIHQVYLIRLTATA